MHIWDLFLVALSLSMDAFAISVCKGLSVPRVTSAHTRSVSLYFGGFQALMPLLGYLTGVRFQKTIEQFDHWVAFFLLGFLGVRMICDACDDTSAPVDAAFHARAMVPLAVATSIDALAVGVTFAFLHVAIVPAAALIGLTTAFVCACGVHLGHRMGESLQRYATVAGGIILIGLGVKILMQHLYGIWV